MTATLTQAKTGRGNIAALMTALLAACVAFQLNASMLSPALVTMGEELKADQALIGLSQTWFFTAAALFSLFLPRLSDIVGRSSPPWPRTSPGCSRAASSRASADPPSRSASSCCAPPSATRASTAPSWA